MNNDIQHWDITKQFGNDDIYNDLIQKIKHLLSNYYVDDDSDSDSWGAGTSEEELKDDFYYFRQIVSSTESLKISI